nr:hypothetical protein A4A59_27045 [Rhizobium leguminosarum]
MGPGAKQAADRPVLQRDDIDPGGYGSFVLAASAANQSAFEMDGRSIFTKFLVEALQTGDAAPNSEDVSINDLHSYVCRQVAGQGAPMEPRLWVDEQTAPVIVARNPKAGENKISAAASSGKALEGVQENNVAGPAPSSLLRGIEADFNLFLGTDPIKGEEALGELAAHGASIITRLLQEGTGRFGVQQTLRMRKLCTLIGQDALTPLIDAIRSGEWHVKTAAAPCFSAFEKRNSAAQHALFELLKNSEFDTRRLTIEASGYAGYSSNIRWELARLAKFDKLYTEDENADIYDYSFGKLFSYVCEALARGFALTGDESELTHLMEFYELCVRLGKGWSAENSIENGLNSLKPVAADSLLKDWLLQPDGPYTKLALTALGQLRNQRTVSAVASRLFDQRDDISLSAGVCLGYIGSSMTARLVAEAFESGSYNSGGFWAASMLYGYGNDWPAEKHLVDTALTGYSEVAGQMLVSLALRNGEAAVDRAKRGLTHSDPYARGYSALALAWARPSNASQLLRHADDEAANELEKTFAISAQILAGSYERGDELHEALRSLTQWHMLRPFWRYQILAALRISHNGKERAQRWAEISQDDSPRIRALIDDYERRATTHGPLSST